MLLCMIVGVPKDSDVAQIASGPELAEQQHTAVEKWRPVLVAAAAAAGEPSRLAGSADLVGGAQCWSPADPKLQLAVAAAVVAVVVGADKCLQAVRSLVPLLETVSKLVAAAHQRLWDTVLLVVGA